MPLSQLGYKMYRARKDFGQYLTYQLLNSTFKNYISGDTIMPSAKISKSVKVNAFTESLYSNPDVLAEKILD